MCGSASFFALPSGDSIDPDEREAILAWARARMILQEVVQTYRFERRWGTDSAGAFVEAAQVVADADASVADPLTYARVLVECCEAEHRDWFWLCCRRNHIL